ncbi:SGNH/GDSL hydrolase family protein [Robiginitalea sp. M366]|uniref:SGNH/GDSL hydrolase family protein n=1 Tax=Robiginitalea aestuariiviva TaxID=3036903 RepID=UPI00240D5803|nr:SGNH/GDSL hydrolase family protein [Robiginitalea aestuariiviva]MDG1572373.1 SGNH/GDSL hydrolase family protein [Robiginitalea aestuariiviva]
MALRNWLCLLLAGIAPILSQGQDPKRFATEVAQIQTRMDSLWDPAQPAVVFTGSSSIRMWTSLAQDFPGTQTLNTGFGGSQATDLNHYLDPLVLDYQPVQVFIYEGDNDLAEGKRPRRILKTLQAITAQIHARYPGTSVVWLAAKPSISRWKLRSRYRRFNRKLRRHARKAPGVDFADVWTPMLQGRKLNPDLFIEDGLHMNASGYRLWRAAIAPKLISTPITP